jgi:hypothetical protein
MARQQHDLFMSVLGGIDVNFVRGAHRVAGMREQHPRRLRRRSAKERKFKQLPLVHAKAPLVETSEHRSDKGSTRLRVRHYDSIRFRKACRISEIPPERDRARDRAKELGDGTLGCDGEWHSVADIPPLLFCK